MNKQHVYKVEGMHCASCEILIEKKLLDLPNVKAVDASTGKGQVAITFEGDRPNPEKLSKIFAEENYKFNDSASPEPKARAGSGERQKESKTNPTLFAFTVAIFIIVAFLLLDKAGVAGILNLSATSSTFAFLGFGLLAGVSSCAALVGGIVLSMSKQWQTLYSEKASFKERIQPHIMFNAGRVVSYGILGGILGLIGSKLQLSLEFNAVLILGVSVLMILLGLQMLGVKKFQKFQFALPKSVTKYIANEDNFQGKYMPFVMGALTFFLPCGFTITAQGLALLSGNFVQGGLIMAMFALGTVPALFLIGLSSVKFLSKPHLALRFSKVAGFLVLFFALFNMSTQMNVLGFTGVGSLFEKSNSGQAVNEKDFPPIIGGKQVIKMEASARGYSPGSFKVRAGIPVRWEITDKGTSGCTNAIISTKLFQGQIDLTPGKVSVKEFTPSTPGKYRFSCWMGMVAGTIEVVNTKGSAVKTNVQTASAAVEEDVIPSGAKGCGEGCGGSGACH